MGEAVYLSRSPSNRTIVSKLLVPALNFDVSASREAKAPAEELYDHLEARAS